MNYYDEIKNELINNELNRKAKNYSVNRGDLNAYYSVGKILSEAGKHYGEHVIKEYSIKLTSDIGKGYGVSNLKRMRQFFYMIEKGAAMPHQLSWSHVLKLLPLSDINEINYYINVAILNNYGYRELGNRIKSNEYGRLDYVTKTKLITKEVSAVTDFVKNPIVIKNNYGQKDISEKMLQKLILENIVSFMKELGTGFSFIDNEYKIKVGNAYNYIDLLLYNIKFKCYVVIELKVTRLNYGHTGQIQNYMNYIDRHIRCIDDNKMVGIIICKKNNHYVIDYCSDKRIISREYELV